MLNTIGKKTQHGGITALPKMSITGAKFGIVNDTPKTARKTPLRMRTRCIQNPEKI